MPSSASAPAGSKAWLLIEHGGPWAEQAAQTEMAAPLGKLAVAADDLGIRVQLIRRPDRESRSTGGPRPTGGRVFAAWTAGAEPWLLDVTGVVDGLDLDTLAAGERPAGGVPVGRMYLVCTHGRRNRCCARFGGPLARALAPEHGADLWETTHLGGHKFAANMVLLPHGLYYGPCELSTAVAAIGAYENGTVLASRFRGRAGQDTPAQQAEHALLAAAGSMPVDAGRGEPAGA